MDERRRIGELLLDAGVITPEKLQEALAEQQRSGGRLSYILIRLGHLSADTLVGFLRDQFGVAAVNLERYQVAEEVLRLVPAAFARERRIVPLHVLGRTLFSSPSTRIAIFIREFSKVITARRSP